MESGWVVQIFPWTMQYFRCCDGDGGVSWGGGGGGGGERDRVGEGLSNLIQYPFLANYRRRKWNKRRRETTTYLTSAAPLLKRHKS